MELWQQAACELRKLVINREVSAVESVQAHLDHISTREHDLHCFITLMEDDAMRQAAQVDFLVRSGEYLPLAGVPIAIKDNINLAGVRTTCGSRLLSNYISPYTATALARVRSAGAVLIGKTNMDEFAMGSSTEYSAYGPTHNPWDRSCVPGGSSGGSAAAVACGLVPLALGSDTGGSVRQPASFCGIVGLKPTYGRVSRYGLVAFASSLDQIGPMARTVSDTAHLLGVISGQDPLDATSASNPEVDCTSLARSTTLKRLRLGVPSELIAAVTNSSVLGVVRKAIDHISDLGAVVDECSITGLSKAMAAYQVLSCAEATSNLARYDGIRYGMDGRTVWAKGFDELVTSNRSFGFGPEVKRRIMLGTNLTASSHSHHYHQAETVRAQMRNQMEELFTRYDALLTPTSPDVAFQLGSKTKDQLSMHASDLFTIPANLAGVPALSIPCGLADGLPVGLQIMGRHFSEELLLRIAYAYEQSVGFPPLPLD